MSSQFIGYEFMQLALDQRTPVGGARFFALWSVARATFTQDPGKAMMRITIVGRSGHQ